MAVADLEFATTTRTGKLLEWLRADAARGRNGAPSAEWQHPNAAAFVLAHGRPYAVDDIGSAQRRLARSLAATHWRVHGPFQHREPALNTQRCLFLDELERFRSRLERLSPSDKQRLLEHALRSSNRDKQARAQEAFKATQ